MKYYTPNIKEFVLPTLHLKGNGMIINPLKGLDFNLLEAKKLDKEDIINLEFIETDLNTYKKGDLTIITNEDYYMIYYKSLGKFIGKLNNKKELEFILERIV